ncbi:MAG TPA: SDR family oxidoreductase [Nitrososphaerales archaeon]|nr:SDR family oxidoreductase [Nitrososphaerales archaeon]
MSWGTLPGEAKIDTEVEVTLREHPPAMRFRDMNALVTGAGKGIGSMISLALAREGANVVVSYNKSEAGAKEVSDQIVAMGRKAMPLKMDVTKWGEVKAAVEKAWSEFGPLDVLVNNAGDTADKQMSWREITEESIDHTIAVDMKGPLFLIHEVGQRMLQRKKGTIVNVGSHVIVLGSPRAPQYAAAKSALIGLSKSYALAFAPWVRINTACPGYVESDMLRKRKDWTPERRKHVLDHTPLKRIARPEQVVPMILFLASDDSINMTGNIIVADGGYTMPGA